MSAKSFITPQCLRSLNAASHLLFSSVDSAKIEKEFFCSLFSNKYFKSLDNI